jgi:hypothetical protein
MLMSGIIFIFAKPEMIQEGMRHNGYPENVALPLIVVSFVCCVLYLIPQTAVLGAILLTGYLGGAVATHVRIGEYGQAVMPIVFGIVLWLGLYLRDARIRVIVPWRS